MQIPLAKKLRFRDVLLCHRTLLAVYILLAIVASVQLVLVGTHNSSEGNTYTDYNNYVIFRQSYFHLVAGKNIYGLFPAEQWDLYKYSPTFALIMGLFARLPDVIGLGIWNLLNALALFIAIRMLPLGRSQMSMLLWFVLLELLTSMQNAQSNGLMAGLLVAAFACMERKKAGLAALWIVAATFIKVYGAVGFCLFLFYPDKIKFCLYAAIWTLVFLDLPLLVMPVHTLAWQYQKWMAMMKEDQSASYGLSVMGWLHSWFGISSGKPFVSIIGIVLFLLPFVRWQLYKDYSYKLLMLASMLIWVIIFNHKAESSTYVIAVTGVGIWYFLGYQADIQVKKWRKILVFLVFIFTCLSPTDIFPPAVIHNFFVPYTIKAIPCIVVWCVVWLELMTIKKASRDLSQTHLPVVG